MASKEYPLPFLVALEGSNNGDNCLVNATISWAGRIFCVAGNPAMLADESFPVRSGACFNTGLLPAPTTEKPMMAKNLGSSSGPEIATQTPTVEPALDRALTALNQLSEQAAILYERLERVADRHLGPVPQRESEPMPDTAEGTVAALWCYVERTQRQLNAMMETASRLEEL